MDLENDPPLTAVCTPQKFWTLEQDINFCNNNSESVDLLQLGHTATDFLDLRAELSAAAAKSAAEQAQSNLLGSRGDDSPAMIEGTRDKLEVSCPSTSTESPIRDTPSRGPPSDIVLNRDSSPEDLPDVVEFPRASESNDDDLPEPSTSSESDERNAKKRKQKNDELRPKKQKVQEPPHREFKGYGQSSSPKKKTRLPGEASPNVERKTLTKEQRLSLRKSFKTLGKAPIQVRGVEPSTKNVKRIECENEYEVARIMRTNGEEFLIYWHKWNFTHCTWETMSSLSGAPLALECFREYEQGMEAIIDNLKLAPWYKEQKTSGSRIGYKFKRFTVPALLFGESDESVEKLSDPSNHPAWHTQIGYWKLKMVELQWLQVLDPDLTFDVPPLYLDCLVEHSKIKPPQLQFVKDYVYSDRAQAYFDSEAEHPHDCLFKSPRDRCVQCRRYREVKLKGTREVVLPEEVDLGKHGYFIKVCTVETNCTCPGGWEECESWLPTYSRYLPLVILHDPRYSGWGVRVITPIPRGAIITEYCGKVMVDEEACEVNTSYQFQNGRIVVDTAEIGNESRFFGHSCDPNMAFLSVFVRSVDQDHSFRHLFVALRDISPGEDLNFDYHPGEERPRAGFSSCRCATTKCRGWV